MCAVVLVCSYLPLELGFVFLMLAEAEEEELVGVKGVLDLYNYAREEEMRRYRWREWFNYLCTGVVITLLASTRYQQWFSCVLRTRASELSSKAPREGIDSAF